VAGYTGDALYLDHKLPGQRDTCHSPSPRLFPRPSDCTRENCLSAHAAAGHSHGLAPAAFLGFGGHRFASTVLAAASWSVGQEVYRSFRPLCWLQEGRLLLPYVAEIILPLALMVSRGEGLSSGIRCTSSAVLRSAAGYLTTVPKNTQPQLPGALLDGGGDPKCQMKLNC
jgi:hypothetical protein